MAPGSWCYDNLEKNGNRYGRLYTWEAAKEAVPPGWRLPTREDWARLFAAISVTAGKELKASTGWIKGGGGYNIGGFNALPGGSRYTDGDFDGDGISGLWWTATECYLGRLDNYAYYVGMDYDDNGVAEYKCDKNAGLSVRCVREY
jgi:uncharacterized protein (TIGR02145 family)